MEYLKPKSTSLERYLMFKTLVNEEFKKEIGISKAEQTKASSRNEARLTLDKFYFIYEVINLDWNNVGTIVPWYNYLGSPLAKASLLQLRTLVLHPAFNYLVYGVITSAAVYQLLDATFGLRNYMVSSTPVCATFIALYTVEMTLKIIVLGPGQYLSRRWNIFDACITLVSLSTLVLNKYFITLSLSSSIFSLRSLRLLDLLRSHVAAYRDILGPFSFIIIKRFISVSVVVAIIYYSFAIIAMECFGGYSLADCCVNSTIQVYFATANDQASSQLFHYYLNNFNDLITSYSKYFSWMEPVI